MINIATVIIAAIALIVSLRGYNIAKRNEKRAIEGSKPLITAKILPVIGQQGWFHIYWSFENRSSHGYKCNFIEIRRPLFSRGITKQQAHSSTDRAWEGIGVFRNPLPIEAAKRKIPVEFTVAKAGTSSTGPFPGPIHWESIYIHISPWTPSKRVSMRVSLSSIDIEERESFFTVIRTIPAVAKNKVE
jgi:hypothetical protein